MGWVLHNKAQPGDLAEVGVVTLSSVLFIAIGVVALQAPDEELQAAGGQPVLPLVELLQPLQVFGVQVVFHKTLVLVPKPAWGGGTVIHQQFVPPFSPPPPPPPPPPPGPGGGGGWGGQV